jgi:hypothetical protein
MLALTPSFQNKQLFFLPKKDKNTKHLWNFTADLALLTF